jgi:hypothetical protein
MAYQCVCTKSIFLQLYFRQIIDDLPGRKIFAACQYERTFDAVELNAKDQLIDKSIINKFGMTSALSFLKTGGVYNGNQFQQCIRHTSTSACLA